MMTLRSTHKPTFRFIIIRNLHQAKRKVGGGFGIMITALFVVFTTPLKDGMFIGVLRVLFLHNCTTTIIYHAFLYFSHCRLFSENLSLSIGAADGRFW